MTLAITPTLMPKTYQMTMTTTPKPMPTTTSMTMTTMPITTKMPTIQTRSVSVRCRLGQAEIRSLDKYCKCLFHAPAFIYPKGSSQGSSANRLPPSAFYFLLFFLFSPDQPISTVCTPNVDPSYSPICIFFFFFLFFRFCFLF